MNLHSLPPGFRFHPTDEELVCHYLSQKVSGSKCKQSGFLSPITDLGNIYQYEPSDLPLLQSHENADGEWFFFTKSSGNKYPNGERKNRATAGGFWKTTGRDRPVQSHGATVGMKKTLVFYAGRAPKGERTKWIMHEYRLLHPPQHCKDSFLLCRVFLKGFSVAQVDEVYSGLPFMKCAESAEDEYGIVKYMEQPDKVSNVPVEGNVSPTEKSVIKSSTHENAFLSSNGSSHGTNDYLHNFLSACLDEPDSVQIVNDSAQTESIATENHIVVDDHLGEKHTSSSDTCYLSSREAQNKDSHVGKDDVSILLCTTKASNQFELNELVLQDILAGDFLELNDLSSPALDSNCLG